LREHVVTILLQAKDKLSNVIKNVVSNVDKDFNKLKGSLSGFDKESERVGNSVSKSITNIDRRAGPSISSFRNKLNDLQDALVKTRKEAEKEFPLFGGGKVTQGSSGKFERVQERGSFRDLRTGFSRGAQVAAETEKEFNTRVAQSKEELKEKKDALRSELQAEKDAAKQISFVRRQALEIEIQARKALIEIEKTENSKSLEEFTGKRKDAEESLIKQRREAFQKERRDSEDAVQKERTEIQKRFIDEKLARDKRLDDLKDEIRARRDDGEISKTQSRDRIREASAAARKENIDRIRARNDEIKIIEKADDKIKQDQQDARDADIKAIESASTKEINRRKSALSEEINRREASENRIAQTQRNELNRRIQIENQKRETGFAQRGRELSGKDPGVVLADILSKREQGLKLDEDTRSITKFEQVSRKAGIAFGDLKRGFRQGRGDLAPFSKELRELDSTLGKIGNNIGRFTRGMGNIVNLRWFLLISFVQILGQAIVVLGSNLVALASSATVAAAALGTGFAAVLAQAIPVAGLLAAAFQRLGVVSNAAALAEKNRISSGTDSKTQMQQQREAIERLADAHYALKTSKEAVDEAERSLKDAHRGVTDAQRQQTRAIQDLAEARKQAAQDIVDANFQERDAAISLREAELGILDAKVRLREENNKSRDRQTDINEAKAAIDEAKQRLAAAQQEGDQAEISKAQQQLALSQQNLQALKNQEDQSKTSVEEAQIAVKRANLTHEEAIVRNKRAREEAKKSRREGVEGNKQVIDARRQVADSSRNIANAEHQIVLQQRALRDSIHSLAIAHREEKDARQNVADATNKQTAAQKNLQDQLKDLSPAERGLFRAFRRIQKVYRENIRPITDIITRSFTFATDKAAGALQNPKLLSALKVLATGIAKAIRELATFFTGDTFIDSFSRFARDAAKNLPNIVKIIENLTTSFLNLAKAGEPVFGGLLSGLTKLTGRLAKATQPNVVKTPTGDAGGGTVRVGKSPLERFIGAASQNLNSWLRLAGAIGRVLRYLIAPASGPGKGLVDDLTKFFNHIANFLRDNPEKVRKFFQNMKDDFKVLASLVGRLSLVLFKAFSSDEATAFTKLIVTTIIPGLTLLLVILGKVSRIILFVFGLPVIGPIAQFALQVAVAEKALNRIFPVSQKLTKALEKLGLQFLKLAKFMIADAFRGFRGTAAGMRELVFIARTQLIPAIAEFNAAAIAFLLSPTGLIIIAIAAIVIGLTLLDRKFHFIKPSIEALGNAFKSVFNWIKEHWKLVAVLLFGPIGLAIDAIVTHWNSIKVAFAAAFRFIRNIMRLIGISIYKEFIKPFTRIAEFGANIAQWFYNHLFKDLINSISKSMGRFSKEIYNGFIRPFKDIAGWFKNIASWLNTNILKPIFRFFGIHSPSTVMYGVGRDIIQGLINGMLSLGSILARSVLSIGKSIVDGIVNGVKSAGNLLKDGANWLKDKLIGGLKSVFKIFSPSLETYDRIGKPLGQGVVEGAKAGLSDLDNQMLLAIRRAISATNREIKNSRTSLQNSFSSLSGFGLDLFDVSRQGQLTPAEKQLKALQESQTRQENQQALSEAKKQQTEAQRQIKSGEAKIARADKFEATGVPRKVEAAAQLRREGKQQIRDAKANAAQAAKDIEDTKTRILEENLQKRAEIERRKLDKTNEIERNNFEKHLQKIYDMATTGKWGAKKTQQKIIDLFNQYEVPYQKSGALLGTTFANALNTAMDSVVKHAGIIHNKIVQKLILTNKEIAAIGRSVEKSWTKVPAPEGYQPGTYGKAPSTRQNPGGFLPKAPEGYDPATYGKAPSTKDNPGGFLPKKRRRYAIGGVVEGAMGKAMPIIAHAGEWVLNPKQQQKLSRFIKQPSERIKNYLFGAPSQEMKEDKFDVGGVVGDVLHGAKEVALVPVKIGKAMINTEERRNRLVEARKLLAISLPNHESKENQPANMANALVNANIRPRRVVSYSGSTDAISGLAVKIIDRNGMQFVIKNKAHTPVKIYSISRKDQLHHREKFAEGGVVGEFINKHSIQQFMNSGEVKGSAGKATPIIAHAGEWVINKLQQTQLSKRLNMTSKQISNWLFGTNEPGKPGAKTTGTKQEGAPFFFGSTFNIVAHTDDDGNVLYFLEFDDGTFGGVTRRDAEKIKASNGAYVPGYVKRSKHSYTPRKFAKESQFASIANKVGMAMGGIVPGYNMPSFAMGGVVPSNDSMTTHGPTINSPNTNTQQKTINQNLNVNKVEGDSDWHYVSRLLAINASEGF
jgi:hypothetical protein